MQDTFWFHDPRSELEKDKKKLAKIKPFEAPKFNIPKSGNSDFDFDLGEEGGVAVEDGTDAAAGTEESLNDFVVNSGEINENPDVNIFKLISNRYLISYPKLLNEKKKTAPAVSK